MKVQTVLYYRYLTRQALFMTIVTIILSLVVCLIFLLTNFIQTRMIAIIIASLIWLLPIFAIIVTFCWFIRFNQTKSKLKDVDLYNRLTNKVVREAVLKSGARIKYLIPKSGQEQEFFKAIQPYIDKERRLLAILKKEPVE